MRALIPPDGPIPARVMIVGEAPGADEEAKMCPFVGTSGQELNKMLHEASITRSECFVTNVVRVRPPNNDISLYIPVKKKDITSKHIGLRNKRVTSEVVQGFELLRKEISLVKPNIIIALGNTPLWALCGEWGITKWRGSMLVEDITAERARVIPTYHPAAILRQWEWRAIAVQDLRRAALYRDGRPYPTNSWQYLTQPTFEAAHNGLQRILSDLALEPSSIEFDIETRAGHIACAGVSIKSYGVCIPLMLSGRIDGYWTLEEETNLVWLLYQILTHPNAEVIGQNLLYDSQYTWRHWRFVPRVKRDTMITQHTLFPGLPKKLDFQASMYCESYRYWKDDSKNWDPKMGENQLWRYNLEDCFRTGEIDRAQAPLIPQMNLQSPFEFQQKLFWPVLDAMIQGVRIDTSRRLSMKSELSLALKERSEFFLQILGHPLNPRSPKQMQALFYEDLKLPIIFKRTPAGNRPTLDENALSKLATIEPLAGPLIRAIQEFRSLGVFLSTFVEAPLDSDGRMRCSYNICGTETFRFSSSENAFGSGTNLQNLPKGDETPAAGHLSFPNIRKLFLPDPGYLFFDLDLDRADLQVVVWEANDSELKDMLHKGADIHEENAKVLKITRQLAKSWVHGTNYGGSARTMAKNCGLTIHQAETMRTRWFQAHPGIALWHQRTLSDLKLYRTVTNKFGYRRFYFERIDGILPEALAWQPQSTVACYINRIWERIYTSLPDVRVLLQVHDSLCGLIPISTSPLCLEKIRELSRIEIPYPDPLIIPISIKTSPLSWGDCA